MSKLSRRELSEYIEHHIPDFHRARLRALAALNLKKVLRRKNPYLFRAKDVTTANDLVRGLLDAYLSSQEETLFGTFLERLAIFVCEESFSGRKSTAEGIDLEFERSGTLYLVAVKSGPNWGNSGQISQMRRNFLKAKKILRTNAPRKKVEAVNGCCYGRESSEDKGDYNKLCGESFWSLISGQGNLYVEIVEPIGYEARERNEEFHVHYAKIVNRFVREFIQDFCAPDGSIVWKKLVRYTSSRNSSRRPRRS